MLHRDKLMPLTSLLLMATYVLTPSYRFSYFYAFSFSSTWVILTYIEFYRKDPVHWARTNLASWHGAFFYDFTGILICTQYFLNTCLFLRLPAHVPAKCTKCLCVFPKKRSTYISLENCPCNDWDEMTYIWLHIMVVYFLTNLLLNL
jgi:hypothetical protein